MRVPDLTEEIVGWRGWNLRVAIDDASPLLISPHMHASWDEGALSWDGVCCCHRSKIAVYKTEIRDLEAAIAEYRTGPLDYFEVDECGYVEIALQKHTRNLGGRRHSLEMAMAQPCHCGINAFDTYDQLISSSYRDNQYIKALGSVALSGEVRGYERG